MDEEITVEQYVEKIRRKLDDFQELWLEKIENEYPAPSAEHVWEALLRDFLF